jgi:hypothetical protein
MPFSSGSRLTAAVAAARFWEISVQFAFADHVLDTGRREPRRSSELIAVVQPRFASCDDPNNMPVNLLKYSGADLEAV